VLHREGEKIGSKRRAFLLKTFRTLENFSTRHHFFKGGGGNLSSKFTKNFQCNQKSLRAPIGNIIYISQSFLMWILLVELNLAILLSLEMYAG
jgi:hypothetical protein